SVFVEFIIIQHQN
ncbi:unnamed protein product, partial [Allacma fusca]